MFLQTVNLVKAGSVKVCVCMCVSVNGYGVVLFDKWRLVVRVLTLSEFFVDFCVGGISSQRHIAIGSLIAVVNKCLRYEPQPTTNCGGYNHATCCLCKTSGKSCLLFCGVLHLQYNAGIYVLIAWIGNSMGNFAASKFLTVIVAWHCIKSKQFCCMLGFKIFLDMKIGLVVDAFLLLVRICSSS